jgi:nicotinamide riboside transporter PnuC
MTHDNGAYVKAAAVVIVAVVVGVILATFALVAVRDPVPFFGSIGFIAVCIAFGWALTELAE